jgi:hypothetical protein
MVAPRLATVVFLDDNSHGDEMAADEFRDKLRSGEIIHFKDEGGIYAYKTNQNNPFKLNCTDCLANGCRMPGIQKLEQYFSYHVSPPVQLWSGFYKHMPGLKIAGNHVDGEVTCACPLDHSSGSSTRKVRRLLQTNIYINGQNVGEYVNPLIMEIINPMHIETYQLKSLLTHIRSYMSGVSKELFSNIDESGDVLWRGIILQPTIQQFQIKLDIINRLYLNRYDFTDLNHLFWYKQAGSNSTNRLLPLPIKNDLLNNHFTLNLANIPEIAFYRSVKSGGMKNIDAPLRYKRIDRGNKDDLIEWFRKEAQSKNKTWEIKGDDIRVVLLDNDKDTKFVYLHNQSDKSQYIHFKAIEHGSAGEFRRDLREQYGGRPTEYVGLSQGNQQFEVVMTSNSTKLIKIKYKGNSVMQVKSGNSVILQEKLFDKKTSEYNKIQLEMDNDITTKEFQNLIRNFHPNYLALPNEDESSVIIGDKEWADFDRFMFTESLQSKLQSEVAPQGIGSRNTRMLKLMNALENPITESNPLSETPTVNRFDKLMETKYIGQQVVEQDDSLDTSYKHRLVPNQKGWFGPDDSEWRLLLDHRSWSHLKADCPRLSEEHFKFLPSGHRLIHRLGLQHYDMKELTEIESISRLNDSPVDFLFQLFSDEGKKEQIKIYDRLSRFVEQPNATEYVFANPFDGNNNSQVFSKHWKSDTLRKPWSPNREPYCITQGVNESEQILTLHRFVSSSDDENIPATQQLCLVMRKEGHKPRAIVVYRTGIPSKPQNIDSDTWDSFTTSMRYFASAKFMRDVIRAFTKITRHLGSKSANGVSNLFIDEYSDIVDFNIRKFNERHDDSLVNLIEQVDDGLSDYFVEYMEEKMWLSDIIR